jgi:MFS family permease
MGSSSAAIALPLIGVDLGVDVAGATWAITLYVLFLAVTSAVYGRFSDLVGVRLPLMVGVGLMTTGAVVAALAPTFDVLLVARMLQGAGVAAVPTLGIAVLSVRYHGVARGQALGRLSGVAASLGSIGPLVGGVVEQAWGWRAVMALPILGLLVVPFLWRVLTGEGTGAKLDLLGAVFVTAASAGLVLILQSPSTGLTVAVAGVLLLLLGVPAVALRVRRRPHGFLPLAVIRNETVVRSAVAAAAVPAAWFALLIAVPSVLVEEGWAPWQVGLLLVPSAVVPLFAARFASALLNRIGGAASLAISGVLASVTLLIAALGAATVSPVILAVSAVLLTLAFGLCQPALNASVGNAVDLHVRGAALGIATLLFLVGGSVGSAVIGGLGGLLGPAGSLAALAILPVVGLGVLMPEIRRTPDAI